MPQPVFHVALDGGKLNRIIDSATNNPARDEYGDFLDGGGMSNPLLAAVHAARINSRRGVSNHQSVLFARSYRRNIVDRSSAEAASPPACVEAAERPMGGCPIPTKNQTPEMTMKVMASIIGVHTSTLSRRIKAGDYTHHTARRGSYVFDLSEFPPDVQAKLLGKYPQLAATPSN